MEETLTIGSDEIALGETKRLDLPVSSLYTGTTVAVPVYVKRGKKPGPTIFVSAAIHGDELNGIEIVSRVINSKSLKSMSGTLIAVPMVILASAPQTSMPWQRLACALIGLI